MMPLIASPRQRMLLWRTVIATGVAYILLLGVWATEDVHGMRMASRAVGPLSNSFGQFKQAIWGTQDNDDPCADWDHTAPPAEDPPNCLRAKQYREFQAYHATGKATKLDVANRKYLQEVERCVLGITSCAERPLIMIDYFYWNQASKQLHGPGEVVWGWPIIDAMRSNGFVPLFIHGMFSPQWMESWEIMRALPSSVHMYMTDSNSAVRCLLDPKCVRPEDYRPHWNESLRFPPAPKAELGVLPAWRIFGINFWGSRPDKYKGTAQSPCQDWGACGDTEWSYHVLGNKWIITPFAYPNGHTQIPMSMEQACRALPVVPHSERKDHILVLGKVAQYFHHSWFTHTTAQFDKLSEAIKPTKFIATCKGYQKDQYPIPQAIEDLGPQDPEVYRELLSSAKVLLGIGKPEISPTPYEALCRGVPVVLPYRHHPEPQGWEGYYDLEFQHGPVMEIGEPYAYSYNIKDNDELIEKLKRAISTPIKPYIPPDMTTEAVHTRVRQILFHDWEGEYDLIRSEHGGKIPKYSDVMVDKCFYGGHVAPCNGTFRMP